MSSTPQLISTEMIKPSSKTPDNLIKLKLTYLDDIAGPLIVSRIFFYQNLTSSRAEISQKLKKSLSKTLTLFYPLAGRYNQENDIFECNDKGCVFIESQVDAPLSDVIKGPKSEELKKYVPLDAIETDATLLIKVTFFSCGGMSIGVCNSHIICDGTSMIWFMKAWANICQGGEIDKIARPNFDLAQHFTNRLHIPRSNSRDPNFNEKKEETLTKRFVFDKEKIAALKRMGTSLTVKDPTRVEVVSAFIWKHYMEINESGPKKNFLAAHALNLRTRVNAHDVDLRNSFGNCIASAFTSSDGVLEFHGLVNQFRSAIRSAGNEYKVKSDQNGDRIFNSLVGQLQLINKEDTNLFVFTSWSSFPFYDVDYGWGAPIWFCTPVTPFNNNVAVLISTRTRDGIEAWVNMSERNMQMFETRFNNFGATTVQDDK